MSLQIRRGPSVDRLTITPVEGELIYDLTERALYIGDGSTVGGVATAPLSVANIEDTAAALFTNGVHTNINYQYDTLNNLVNSAVDLTTYVGVMTADGFRGNVYSYDDTLLIDGVLKGFQLDGTVRSNIVPATDDAYDLGNNSTRFRDLYLSGNTLYLGAAVINAVGPAVNLPAGSTVNGVPIGGGSGIIEGQSYNISIIGDDSSVIVDSFNRTVNAPGGIAGDLVGDVTGNLSGNVIGDDSSIILNSLTNSVVASGGLFGDLVGDVTGNLEGLVIGNVIGNVTGELLGNVTGDVTGNVIGSDSSLIVNIFNNSINAAGGVFGDLIGGSVFGLDSSLLVDSVNGQIVGDINARLGGNLDTDIYAIVNDSNLVLVPSGFTQFGSTVTDVNGNIVIRRSSYNGDISTGLNGFFLEQHHENERSDRVIFARSRGTTSSPQPLLQNDWLGELAWIGWPAAGSTYTVGASIRVIVEEDSVGAGMPTTMIFRTCDNTGVGRGVVKIDSQGRLMASTIVPYEDSLQIFGDLVGSVFSDDSTRIIDGINGSITAGSFVQFGSLTASERNALTAINGMVIYNTTYNRFEGRQNGIWINLDDGTAAGV
jgi:hypothetical protein